LTENYDLIVIGAGPAGETGAAKAAQYGKRVALIERESYLGGAGINTGTVPSKTLRESALYFSGLQQRGLFGIDYSLKENLTIKDFMYRERTVVEKEREMIAQHIRYEKIVLIHGDASLKDEHTVRIKTEKNEKEIGIEIWHDVVRSIFLSVVDQYWTEHLTAIEDLREGINLRGYAQLDPLVEYKNEAYSMFERLVQNINYEFTRRLFRVEVQVNAPEIVEEQKKEVEKKQQHSPGLSRPIEEKQRGH